MLVNINIKKYLAQEYFRIQLFSYQLNFQPYQDIFLLLHYANSQSSMCNFLGISRSSYYEWLNSSKCNRQKEDKELTKMIKKIFKESRSLYGTRRIRSKLLQLKKTLSRKRISRLMKAAHLYCKTKRRFKITTNSKHNNPISPNLLQRQFNSSRPDQYWVGDITYIPTGKGWLYLATVINLYSRKVIGWSMSNRMQTSLVNDALLMALWQRKPVKGLIWHIDRGILQSHQNSFS